MTGPWEGLLAPVSADAPCGENLEDTPLLASFDTFRVFGQATPLDPPPDWGDLRTQALDALPGSKDLRLLACLATALLRTDGLAAFSATLPVAASWLETWPGNGFPLGDENAILRRNALNCLADPMAVLDGVRRTPLVRSRQHGIFSLRDIDMAAGQVQPGPQEAPADEVQINAAFSDGPIEELQALQVAMAGGVAAAKRINAVMAGEGGSEAVPALDALTAQLTKAERLVSAQVALRAPSADGTDGEVAGSGGGRLVAVGGIRSPPEGVHAAGP